MSPPVRYVDLLRDRRIAAWSFYDWANSAFATSVMAGFFPVFFKQFWSAGSSAEASTSRLGLINAIASFLLAFLSPVIGALCDLGGLNKRFLGVFAAIGIFSTGYLFFIEKGDWPSAALLYVTASVGFFAGNNLYDSLIKSVTPHGSENSVSSLGFSLGYLGGGILLALNLMMVTMPNSFGLSDASEAVRFAFFSVALWWLVFSIPLFLWVPSPSRQSQASFPEMVTQSIRRVGVTLRSLRTQKDLFLFILAYFFYIDGVHTIIKMSVDYGLGLGLQATSLLKALLLVQLIGFPAAVIAGVLSEKFGSRAVIRAILVIYGIATLGATQMQTEAHFYLLAAVIAAVQGGAQALSRGVFAKMIPLEAAGEWFGFFNLVGKFSAILGPLIIALVAPYVGLRWSILVVLFLFIAGWLILNQVKFLDKAK